MSRLCDRLLNGPPLVFGHRGYAAKAPENTLSAFRLAADQGVPAVELDVQLSADGRLVVIHDQLLTRLAGKNAAVAELSSQELAEIDVGSHFSSFFAGEGVPLLSQVIETVTSGSRNTYVDIEIKPYGGSPDSLAQKVTQEILRFDIGERVLVSTFYPGVLYATRRALRRNGLRVPTALIYHKRRKVNAAVTRMLAHVVGHSRVSKPEHILLPKRRWSGSPAERKLLIPITWTVNSVSDAEKAVAVGAKGLIGDDPGLLMDWLSSRERRNTQPG